MRRHGRTVLRRTAWVAFLLCLASAVAVFLVGFAVWLRLAPGRDDWTIEVQLPGVGAWPVSVSRALEAATDPRFARWIDGRHLSTGLGDIGARWQTRDGTLRVACSPCWLQHPALGQEPIRIAGAEVEMRRLKEFQYLGRLRMGAIDMPFTLTATRQRLVAVGQLPPTPIAGIYRLLADAVPETRSARIEGTIAGRVTLDLPTGRWSVDPHIDGFTVSGLGTDVLVDADPPSMCLPIQGRVAPQLERAVIGLEDPRFMEHPGYDVAAMQAALQLNQRDGRAARGGSTITQRLASLVFVGDERSLSRKARELLYAAEMERTLGKGRILRLYLGLAPWGPGDCRVRSASMRDTGGFSAPSERLAIPSDRAGFEAHRCCAVTAHVAPEPRD